MSVFKPGDTCYLIDGDQVEYVSSCGDGHIVRHIYGDEDEEPNYGRPYETREVFAEPPRARRDEETRAAVEKLAGLRSEISAATMELSAARRGKEEALKTIGAHPDLIPLGEWLRGEITHVVMLPVYGGSIQIKTLAEAVKPTDESDARNGHVRLLSLCGGKKYNDSLTWQLNHYSDGSSSSGHHCLLATSVENAKERLQVWVDRELRRSGNDHSQVAIATSALALGLTISAKWAERVADQAKKSQEQTREKLVREIASYRAYLAKHEADLAKLEEVTP